MAIVGYSCPFVPPEWIAAHGHVPRRVRPGAEGAALPGAHEGLCPYAEAFGIEAERTDLDAVIFTTACDPMRRIHERAPGRAFLMHVPASWEQPSAYRYYRDELLRLSRFMVELGGMAPGDDALAATVRDYASRRARLRERLGTLPWRQSLAALRRYHEIGEVPPEGNGNPSAGRGARLALLGGPMLLRHEAIFDVIEGLGGQVVLDATAHGERTLPPPPDPRRLTREPLDVLCELYFGSLPDAFRRPNSLLYQWLQREISARNIDGVLYVHYVWCDIWQAEARRFSEWCTAPTLVLDLSGDALSARVRTRVEAFLEVFT